jgi:hypothetical protein
MIQALLFISLSLSLAQSVGAKATEFMKVQELLCSAVIQQYLIENPTEPWSENAYIDRVIENQCQVYVPWRKSWPNESCVFYYIVDLAARKVLWKQDLSCDWSGY